MTSQHERGAGSHEEPHTLTLQIGENTDPLPLALFVRELRILALRGRKIGGQFIAIEQFGGNDNPDRGDAYKGACTDALSKCASYLGIGMDV